MADKRTEEVVIKVRRTYSQSGEILKVENKSKVLAVRVFATEPARTWASVGKTIPLEKYGESFANVKIDLGMSVPCYLEEEPEAHKYVMETIYNRLFAEESKIRKAYKRR